MKRNYQQEYIDNNNNNNNNITINNSIIYRLCNTPLTHHNFSQGALF